MEKAEWYMSRDGHSDHLVYLDKKASELEKLLTNKKVAIIRGAAGKKVPLGGRVKINDTIYFVETGTSLMVVARANVKQVIETPKMTPEEASAFLNEYSTQLNLSSAQYDRWSSKKYLCIVFIDDITEIEPFKYQRLKNMDDWIITDDINKIKENV